MGRASRLNFPQSRRQPLPNPSLVGPGGSVIDTRPPVMLDSYGRALQVGDGIVLSLQRPPIFRITKCEPATDPGIPPGMMDLVAHCVLRFISPRAQPQAEFLMVMDDQEMAQVFGGPAVEKPEHEQGTSVSPASAPQEGGLPTSDLQITRVPDEDGDDRVS